MSHTTSWETIRCVLTGPMSTALASQRWRGRLQPRSTGHLGRQVIAAPFSEEQSISKG
ncbi:hypothetical protein PS834_00252 [Pseudomonas fluorescens]|nr:hypothetical protein PS834_00252 [Pseudomonas fluorescens]